MRFYGLISAFIPFVLVIVDLVVGIIDIAFTREICEPREYYEPYAKVLKTRKGPVVTGIYRQGFINLAPFWGLLCINGPAFVYMRKESSFYTEPEVQLFQHDCLTFNIVDAKDYQNGYPGIEGVKKGAKIYGVFLLAPSTPPLDIRRSGFQWFHRPQFEWPISTSSSVDGSSFAMMVNDGGAPPDVIEDPPGPSAYCFTMPKERIQGRISASPGTLPQFCNRKEEDPNEDFDEVFRRKLNPSSYIWRGCDGDGGDGGSGEDTTAYPMPDFRTIDLETVNRGSPGKKLSSRVRPLDAISINFPESQNTIPVDGEEDESEEDDETATQNPMRFVSTAMEDCVDVEPLSEDCGSEAVSDSCDVLHHVLAVTETDWEKPELVGGGWRKDLFSTVIKLYGKVCPQVSAGLAPAVFRIVEFLLEKVAVRASTDTSPEGIAKNATFNTPDPERLNWTERIQNLSECNAQKLPLYRTKDFENEKKKKKVLKALELYEEMGRDPNSTHVPEFSRASLDEYLQDVQVMFPYRIYLPSPVDKEKQMEVIGTLEAADLEFDLDWAIDTFWKISSTVLGYCLDVNTSRKRSINVRSLEDSLETIRAFDDDVMQLLKEQWKQYSVDTPEYIFGNYGKLYEQLFGEFIHGVGSRYVDACNDGAYWFPDARKVILKIPRPIKLKERQQNFFIQSPLFNKN